MTKIFWVTASKGGTGKTFLSMCLHASLYSSRIINPRKTLLLDLNAQNKDLFNIISRGLDGKPMLLELGNNRRIRVSVVYGDYGPVVATVRDPLDLPSYILIPALLAEHFELDGVIVDTNLNLSSLSTLNDRDIALVRNYVSNSDIYPTVFFIWAIGSITRYVMRSKKGDIFEVESILSALKNLGTIFEVSEEHFSQNNLVITINTNLWLYNTITILRFLLSELDKKILEKLISRDDVGLYTFSRLTKDIVLKAIRIVADAIVASSGTKPKFRYIEIFFIIALYHLLFGNSQKLLSKLGKTRVEDEIKALLELLKDENKVSPLPANLFVIPPSEDIYNTQALIHSAHLLSKEDIEALLSDPNRDNLPYRTIRKTSDILGKYLAVLEQIKFS